MFEDNAWKRLTNKYHLTKSSTQVEEPTLNTELPKANTKRSKTAQKTYITFTGPFHTFSLSLGKRSRKAAISVIVFLALFFVFGLISIPYTIASFMELHDITQRAKDAYQTTLGENLNLKTLLKETEMEKQRQAELENLTVQNAEQHKDIAIDFNAISLEQKTMLLKNVPNGKPITYADISSGFGSRNHPILGRSAFHEGMDLRASIGTKVFSTADGIVVFAGSNGGYGNMLVIEHSYGFKTIYAHLSRILVTTGDFIGKGQNVALSGNTGMSSGPHLHYEVRFRDSPLNPSSFLEWDLKNFTNIFNKEKNIKWGYLIEATKWPQQQQTQQASSQLEQKSSAK